jgi:hypothetical protein
MHHAAVTHVGGSSEVGQREHMVRLGIHRKWWSEFLCLGGYPAPPRQVGVCAPRDALGRHPPSPPSAGAAPAGGPVAGGFVFTCCSAMSTFCPRRAAAQGGGEEVRIVLKLRAATHVLDHVHSAHKTCSFLCACLLWVVDPRPSPFFLCQCAPASEQASSRTRDWARQRAEFGLPSGIWGSSPFSLSLAPPLPDPSRTSSLVCLREATWAGLSAPPVTGIWAGLAAS